MRLIMFTSILAIRRAEAKDCFSHTPAKNEARVLASDRPQRIDPVHLVDLVCPKAPVSSDFLNCPGNEPNQIQSTNQMNVP